MSLPKTVAAVAVRVFRNRKKGPSDIRANDFYHMLVVGQAMLKGSLYVFGGRTNAQVVTRADPRVAPLTNKRALEYLSRYGIR